MVPALLRPLRILVLVLAALLPRVAPAQDAPGAWSGLWWNPQESGWGIHLTQRRDIVFAALFGYGSNGEPRWWTASDCRMVGTACQGAVYETRGPRYFGATFDPSAVTRTRVGELSITFTGAHTATLSYTINGRSHTVAIQRQFDAGDPVPPAAWQTDIYWQPLESGWGLTVSEQRLSMFLVLFAYDDAGNPAWYFASRCLKYASGEACRGSLYRASGPALGAGFDPTRVVITQIGDISFSWLRSGVMLQYTVGNIEGERMIVRQQF
jgi:hypothetical protein